MKLNMLDNIKSKFFTVLNSIDNLLKQRSLKKENKRNIPPSNFELKKQKQPKEIYTHKGSAYKGKGNVNTDTATFNHPRKDVPRGRSH